MTMNGHSTQHQQKCKILPKKNFIPNLIAPGKISDYQTNECVQQKLQNSIPLETLAISRQHGLKLKSNSRCNSYDQIDNYPTSPFGHSSCGSQKTFDYSANESSNISVKFPKLKYVKICLLSLLVIYTLVNYLSIFN